MAKNFTRSVTCYLWSFEGNAFLLVLSIRKQRTVEQTKRNGSIDTPTVNNGDQLHRKLYNLNYNTAMVIYLQAFCYRAKALPYLHHWSHVELRLMLICHRFAELAWQRLQHHNIFHQVQPPQQLHFPPSTQPFYRPPIR